MSLNKVAISGNLGRDAELRRTPGGLAVCQFSVAVNTRVKTADGWADRANWIDCTMFGNRAESVAEYLKKGTKCAVEGSLRQTTWQDRQTGQNRSKVEVIVDELEFMSQRQQQQQGYGQQPYDAADRQRQQVADNVQSGMYDEEIPF